MKYIKLYENYISVDIDIDEINYYLNNSKVMKLVKNVINSLSNKNRRLLFNFLSSKINIDNIEKYIKKFNMFDKLKKTNKSDINEIVDEIEPKTETISGIITAILILSIIGFLFDKGSGWKKLTIIILCIIAYSHDTSIEDVKEKEIYIVKGGKEYTLTLEDGPSGKYKATIIDEKEMDKNLNIVDFQFKKMNPDEIKDYLNSK